MRRTTRLVLLFGATAALFAVVVAVFMLMRSRPASPRRTRAVARAPLRSAFATVRPTHDRAPSPARRVAATAQPRPEAPRSQVQAPDRRPVATLAIERREATLEDHTTDAAARVQFDAAFDAEPRDEAWAASSEAAITAVLAGSDQTSLVEVSCRSTLCRVEVAGDRVSLPPVPPLDGIAWWLGDREGTATLLLVRDGAEIPLPTDPDA